MSTKDIKIYNCLDEIAEKLNESLRLFDNLIRDGECILEGDVLSIGKQLADLCKKTSYAAGSIGFQALPNADFVHQMTDKYEDNKVKIEAVSGRLEQRIDAHNTHSEAIWVNKMN